jgi:hypothetical protein
MNRQTLTDACNHIIGYIDTAADGKRTGKDARFHTVGYYDPRTNTTRDAQRHMAGHGNLQASLITRR